ncbi:hypothetical protein [Bacillus sp. CECT 9360]|uniref:hypothetical protein n=1 Tax=Bacillus sp. CECT 9360 TaxID=2845821 RepID=UPI001E483618|nr:hypothetical protein [Bacillus sp. CECT 9360]CAH0346441.1 hypothetical protein BCI9360_02775 [Bacillus sp. CECT 9360]
MNQNQAEQFLAKMHELVRNGKRYFVRRTRHGVSYIQQLADLGLTSVDEAWEIVLKLNGTHRVSGPEFDRNDPECGKVVWVFKMEVNGLITYIKLKDEELKRGCVCLSFHEDDL